MRGDERRRAADGQDRQRPGSAHRGLRAERDTRASTSGRLWDWCFPGPTLQPDEEQEEGCYWIPAPNQTDMAIDRWEITLNPGAAHFLVSPWQAAGAPVVDQWQVNN